MFHSKKKENVMLKKLQKRFIGIAMFALVSVFMVQSIAVNMINIYQKDLEVRETLKLIADNNGVLPHGFQSDEYFDMFFNQFVEHTVETPYSTRYFVVEFVGNKVTKISTEHIAAVDQMTAFEYASEVYKGDYGFGFIDVYRYYYVNQGPKSMIVFVDYQKDIFQTLVLATISAFVSIVSVFVLLVCVYWLSKKALKPVEDSIIKQKQFITDASHELKTPLSIISADVEVMEMCEGENEWLTSIKNQTVRMNHLVKNMVDLARLHEMQDEFVRAQFDLTNAVLETASNFEAVATVQGKNYAYSAVSDVKYYGNEADIRQLIYILCDNAIKYTNEKGSIRLTLYKTGKSIVIEITNTCESIDPETVSKMFDRFYRADSSRARETKTGGYGIGLSIAKAITERHNGRIKVFTTGENLITFKVTL